MTPSFIEHEDKRYRVLRELGHGHSGTVYLAQDPHGHQVAIKCLSSQSNEATLRRLRQEFVLLRSLQHPNIAQPTDFGLDKNLDRYFFVTEYVHGVSLDLALCMASDEQALHLFAQGLRALDYMHREGVFHCDLKPGNILVTPEDHLKIIDFDVAVRGSKAVGTTLAYCAPELLMDETTLPDARSDLFSYGATFYYCLTRKKPFQAKNFQELIVAHSLQKPKLPSEWNPRLGTAWDGLLMGLLQVNPSQRYHTASSVLQQLHPLLGKKKLILSEEDISYRLRQHGVPIGKTSLLNQVEYFLEAGLNGAPAPKDGWITGESGLGASYTAAEIRALAQLKGLPCFIYDREHPVYPTQFPFVWILDDLEALSQDPARTAALAAKVQEWNYRGQGERMWIFWTGFFSETHLAPAFRPLLQNPELHLQLSAWSPAEIRDWLADIFQSEDLPPFLISELHRAGAGNPRQIADRLRSYLKRGLILDPRGIWRKDLFHPSPAFQREFEKADSAPEYEDKLEHLPQLEQELLAWMSLCEEALPPEFFAELLQDEAVYAALRRLTAAAWLSVSGQGYRIAIPGLRSFLNSHQPHEEVQRRHDRLAEKNSNPELIRYHRSRGSDILAAAQAWAESGDDYARRGLWQSAQECYAQAYAALLPGETERRFAYMIDQGKCLVPQGRLEEAHDFFSDLLRAFEGKKKKNRRFLAKIYERLGVVETKRGGMEAAREYFNAGLRSLEPEREPLEQYLAMKNFLAGLDLSQGRVSQAVAAYQENFAAAAVLPWERRRVLTNNDLGAALLKDGQAGAAIAHWESLLPDLEKREDKNPLVRCLFQIGQAYFGLEDPSHALEFLEKARNAATDLQNFEMELRIFNALANVLKEKDPERALEMYERALDAAFQTQDAYSTAVVLLNMGFLLSEQQQPARAKYCLSQGLRYLASTASEGKHSKLLREAKLELAKLCRELGQDEEAQAYEEQANHVKSEK
ncbi:MAG TPA: hypothetical protein DF383_13745 [Deltaproteobacteria bacterium]|nr:hypothetical protein [Deltaproteobacteria bacterium]